MSRSEHSEALFQCSCNFIQLHSSLSFFLLRIRFLRHKTVKKRGMADDTLTMMGLNTRQIGKPNLLAIEFDQPLRINKRSNACKNTTAVIKSTGNTHAGHKIKPMVD